MKKCPKCGNIKFFVTAHVAQDWLVDRNGDWVKTLDECSEIDHEPDNGDMWECSECGYYAPGIAFETDDFVPAPEEIRHLGLDEDTPLAVIVNYKGLNEQNYLLTIEDFKKNFLSKAEKNMFNTGNASEDWKTFLTELATNGVADWYITNNITCYCRKINGREDLVSFLTGKWNEDVDETIFYNGYSDRENIEKIIEHFYTFSIAESSKELMDSILVWFADLIPTCPMRKYHSYEQWEAANRACVADAEGDKETPKYRNISLVDENGTVLGAGAISCDGDPREKEALMELFRQVARSGIKAGLHFENGTSISLDAIGDLMKEYQDSSDFFEAFQNLSFEGEVE